MKGKKMADKFDINAKVTALVLEQCQDLQITPSTLLPHTQFEDLGFDWLSCMQLIMSLEEEFSIIISDEDAQQLVSIQTVVAYVQAHAGK